MTETSAQREARHAMENLPVEDRDWFIQLMSWEESSRTVLAGTPFKHSVVGVFPTAEIAERIVRDHNAADALAVEVKPLDDWHEDLGDVLWWCWRDGEWLGEAPYVGSPLDCGLTVECITQAENGDTPAARFNVGGWPGYHTHWSPIPLPAPSRANDPSFPTEGGQP
ncbi:hypothetical protein VQ042_17980 [Aurantimonas sp. A2-1-M11]|uniref:hypothetical protein n=1 Tax=Aurantimonas sp. A2-1-M11 TaxID=3113712 RepID=UPI002F935869